MASPVSWSLDGSFFRFPSHCVFAGSETLRTGPAKCRASDKLPNVPTVLSVGQALSCARSSVALSVRVSPPPVLARGFDWRIVLAVGDHVART